MTYNGDFNTRGLNTVRIPSVTHGIFNATVSEQSPQSTPLQYYVTEKNIYTVGINQVVPFTSIIYLAKLQSLLNQNALDYAIPDARLDNCLYPIYPNPINGYFYSFGTISSLGNAATSKIYRAAVTTPTAWNDTGVTITSPQPMVYVDSTKVWLFGGGDHSYNGGLGGGNTSFNTIFSAPLSNPLNFTSAGTLPASRDGAVITKVGSTIYMYGGRTNGTLLNTILSAPASNPASWTAVGTLPFSGFSSIYNDGSFIYLFPYGVADVYRTSVSTPTTFSPTPYTTLPSISTAPLPIVNNGFLYLLDSVSQKASLSDLTIWSVVFPGLASGVRSTHIIQDKSSNKIFAIGGYTFGSSMTNLVQSASLSNPVEWALEAASGLVPIGGGELIKTRGFYYIIGGNGVTGNIYTASISNPLAWTSSAGGPPLTFGKAVIVGDYLFYLGGENVSGSPTPSNTCYRVAIDGSNSDSANNTWKTGIATYLKMFLPIPLSRFALIRSGGYIYILGGITTGPTMNATIYRTQESRLINSITSGSVSNWVNVGTLTNPMVNPSIAIINNYVYLIGGGANISFNTSSSFVTSARMDDLANGICSFVEENGGTGSASTTFAESKATVIDDQLFFIGGRTTIDGVSTLSKTFAGSTHTLIIPKTPEGVHALPTIDKYGSIGVYSSFQRTGYLPWLTFDSTSNLKQ